MRIYKKLIKLGLEVNIKIVKRLMKENGNGTRLMIYKKFKNHNKLVDTKETIRNILKRNFGTEKLNEQWVSKITYVWTKGDG